MQPKRDEKSKLVIWTCPKGHPNLTGFLTPQESSLRFCSARTGAYDTCMEPMNVVYDERPQLERNAEQLTEEEKLLRISKGLQEAQKNLRERLMSSDQVVGQLGIALKGIRKVGK